MKYLFSLFCFFIAYSFSSAQDHDYNWIFGSYELDGGVNRRGNIINFSDEQITMDVYEKGFDMDLCNVSYSDQNGELAFSSNGCSLYGADGIMLENGDSLNVGETADEFCYLDNDLSGYIATTQSMLALPSPANPDISILFHKNLIFENNNSFNELLYSSIDLLNNRVLEKNVLVDSLLTSGLLTAVRNTDLNGWWLISPKRFTSEKMILALNEQGQMNIKHQDIGLLISDNNHSSSACSFSADGSKYAIFGEADGLQLFDFDRSTGTFSNYQYIEAPKDYMGGWCGLSFSASGRFLYTCHYKKIYQYDLWRADIEESMIEIDWIENYDDFWGDETPFFKMERGPDCRIYMAAYNSTNTMHVIHYPDRKGEACMVQQNIRIPAYNIATLPHFPNYRLGTAEVCDSTKAFPPELVTALEDAIPPTIESDLGITVYPNPSQGFVKLELPVYQNLKADFFLNDLHGNVIFNQELPEFYGSYQFNLSHLPKGMYFYSIISNGEKLKAGKILLQ